MAKKFALVLGGSANVVTEAKAALKLFEPDAVIAINDMIAAWPDRITHACTLHGDKLYDWQQARKNAGYNTNYQTIYFDKDTVWEGTPPKITRQMDFRWPGIETGSSGLYAVKIMLDLGYEKVVLAGVPMSPGGGHFVRKEQWDSCHLFRGAWVGSLYKTLGRVKSMSGWTEEVLGSPTSFWINN